jgi:hypothetical protein
MNNVRHIRSAARQPESVKPEREQGPTPLQKAVLDRAREMRERKNEGGARSPAQWAVSAVLAMVCFAIMFGAVDVILRKMQHLTEAITVEEAPPAAAPVQPQAPDQPYFIDLQPPPPAEAPR